MKLRPERCRVALIAAAIVCPLHGFGADAPVRPSLPSPRPAYTPPAPSWASENLGRVNFDIHGDQRTRNSKKNRDDFSYFELNEDGVITGEEFLKLQPSLLNDVYVKMNSEFYLKNGQALIGATDFQLAMDEFNRKSDEERKAIAQVEREKSALPRLAILILNRILDHEAMKLRLEPEVSDELVNYIVRSSLASIAMGEKKLPSHPLPEKYQWVMDERTDPRDPKPKTCHSTAVVNFNPDKDANGWAVLPLHYAVRHELAPNQSLDSVSNEQLFEWVKSAVGGGGHLDFSADWEYAEGGIVPPTELLKRMPGWPTTQKTGVHLRKVNGSDVRVIEPVVDAHCHEVRKYQGVAMSLNPFPKTWQEFRAGVRAQLNSMYRMQLRRFVWEKLFMERNREFPWQAQFAATSDQIDRAYEALKLDPHGAGSPIYIPREQAKFVETVVSGPKSKPFAEKFYALLDQAERAGDERFKNTKMAVMQNNLFKPALIAVTKEIRETAARDAYSGATQAFAKDISSGKLKVAQAFRTEYRVVGAPEALAANSDAEEIHLAFDEFGFFATRIVPRKEWAEAGGSSIKIMTAIGVEPAPPLFKSKDNDADREAIQAFLRALVSSKLEGKAERELAYTLYARNPFVFEHSLCEDSFWPCVNLDRRDGPRILAENLLPEILFPGQKLPTLLQRADASGRMADAADEPGKPPQPRYTSTLGHPEALDRVMAFSTDYLAQVFVTPNDYVDPRDRLQQIRRDREERSQ